MFILERPFLLSLGRCGGEVVGRDAELFEVDRVGRVVLDARVEDGRNFGPLERGGLLLLHDRGAPLLHELQVVVEHVDLGGQLGGAHLDAHQIFGQLARARLALEFLGRRVGAELVAVLGHRRDVVPQVDHLLLRVLDELLPHLALRLDRLARLDDLSSVERLAVLPPLHGVVRVVVLEPVRRPRRRRVDGGFARHGRRLGFGLLVGCGFGRRGRRSCSGRVAIGVGGRRARRVGRRLRRRLLGGLRRLAVRLVEDVERNRLDRRLGLRRRLGGVLRRVGRGRGPLGRLLRRGRRKPKRLAEALHRGRGRGD
mmetsp:Transcript_22963/g.91079  ORF Transcript_22963/g.91079 Transcript_22963/m.91079 type:complete len:312 (-) Transcript_22963:31-966(-)